MPAPPQRSGTMMPSRPSSPSRAKIFFGNLWLLSISAATGAISRLARSRAVSWISFCSGDRSKSIVLIPPRPGRRAFLDERPHAFFLIVGPEQRREQLALDLDAGRHRHVELARRTARLCRRDGRRRLGRDLRRPSRGPARSSASGSVDGVDEPDAQRLVGVDDGAGVDQLARACAAPTRRSSRWRAAEARDDAQADLGQCPASRCGTRR